jgi:hypothetical protein
MSLILLWDSEGDFFSFYYNYRQIDLIGILFKIGVYGLH